MARPLPPSEPDCVQRGPQMGPSRLMPPCGQPREPLPPPGPERLIQRGPAISPWLFVILLSAAVVVLGVLLLDRMVQ